MDVACGSNGELSMDTAGVLLVSGLRLLGLEPSKRSVRVIWLPSSGCTEDLAAGDVGKIPFGGAYRPLYTGIW